MKRNPFKKEQNPGRQHNQQPTPAPQTLPESFKAVKAGKKLVYRQFRHNETDAICDWINNEKIELQTIAANGNKMLVFYWKPLSA